MLYPLSYEGGDGAERGAKLGATARKPWGKGSSGVLGRSKVALWLGWVCRPAKGLSTFMSGVLLWFADQFSQCSLP